MRDSATRLAGWARANAPLIRSYAGLLAIAVLIGIGIGALPQGAHGAAANLAGFLGILTLSVPTVRLNEQARQVHRAKDLARRARAEDAEDAERLARLEALAAILAERKGGWTRPVHAALYAGYALLFASALARLI